MQSEVSNSADLRVPLYSILNTYLIKSYTSHYRLIFAFSTYIAYFCNILKCDIHFNINNYLKFSFVFLTLTLRSPFIRISKKDLSKTK